MKYFKPKSLSWLAAVTEGIVNVVRAYGIHIPVEVDGLILAVFGIGIRGAINDEVKK